MKKETDFSKWEEMKVKREKLNSDFYLLSFGKYQITCPSLALDEVLMFISDFGISLLSGEKYDAPGHLNCWESGLEGPYELEDCFIKEKDIVIDAGASIGIFSLFISERVGNDGKIYVFEPVEKIAEICKKNLRNNNVKNSQVFKCVLGDCNKKINFFISDNQPSNSSIFERGDRLKKEEVEQTTLDSFVEKNNIKKVDFIKADIEGAERYMLKGAERTIKKFKPKIAICTYHFKDDPEVIENILREFVPEYKIVHKYKKLYAHAE